MVRVTTEYVGTVRRIGRLFILLPLSLAVFGGGIYLAIIDQSYRDSDGFLMITFAASVAAILLSLANVMRRHRWRVEPDGLRVREGPRVPLTGLRRHRFIRWQDISGLQTSGYGGLRELHVSTRDGQRFSMAQRQVSDPGSRFLRDDPEAPLEALEQAIREHIAGTGAALATTGVALSFLETRRGLLVIAVLFLLSVALAGATLWMLASGQNPARTTRSNHEALALLLLGPLLTSWLFVKKYRSRQQVLRQAASRTPTAERTP